MFSELYKKLMEGPGPKLMVAMLIVSLLLILAPFMTQDPLFKYCGETSGKIEDQPDGAKGLSMAGVAILIVVIIYNLKDVMYKPKSKSNMMMNQFGW